MVDFSYGIITISDSCHRNEAVDKSGPCIKVLLQNHFNAFKISQATVPDEIDEIEKMLLYYTDDLKLNLVITTGGTGCSKRDVTPEATKRVIEREFPQLSTLMLLGGLNKTKFAALTRGICGIRGDTLILNFPGSKKAVEECFESVWELLPHAMELICDMKSKTQEIHKSMQGDAKAFAGPPKYYEVCHSESKERKQGGKEDKETSIINTMRDLPADAKFDLYRALKTLDPKSSADFSEFIKQNSSNLDKAIFGDEEEAEKEEAIAQAASSSKTKHDRASNGSKSKVEAVPKKNVDFSEYLKQYSSNLDNAIFGDEKEEVNVQAASSSKAKAEANPKKTIPIVQKAHHVCPHKTANVNDPLDRNSPYPMIEVHAALDLIFNKVAQTSQSLTFKSPMDCPPFRASLKDGYAMKSSSSSAIRKIIGFISAGDGIITRDFGSDECYKINTGAPVPDFADCIVQVEDTKLTLKDQKGVEKEIEVLKMPKKNLDIRGKGSDLKKNEILFSTDGILDVAQNTLLASVGLSHVQKMPRIAIISTGDELMDPSSGELPEGKIYDSNTTMLKLLCQKYGFEVQSTFIAQDDYASLKEVVLAAMDKCQVIISSGGVSMGDKDFVKPLLKDLGYNIHFGRVNVKPGKPMTFATNEHGSPFFALPGNPVSAFVTFHIFVLPALRFMCGFTKAKSILPTISVILQDPKYELDERPEYVRATVVYNNKNSIYEASITYNQISSRIASLVHGDVLIQLPSASEVKNRVLGKGSKLKASVIDQFFLSGIIE